MIGEADFLPVMFASALLYLQPDPMEKLIIEATFFHCGPCSFRSSLFNSLDTSATLIFPVFIPVAHGVVHGTLMAF